MAELSEYENYAMMVQHCVLGHSHAFKTDEFKKELTQKSKGGSQTPFLTKQSRGSYPRSSRLGQVKNAEDRVKAVENVAKVAQAKAKEANDKESQSQIELQVALAMKAAEPTFMTNTKSKSNRHVIGVTPLVGCLL
ncbi:hypothetical protein CsSME_00004231 [Camellia sinensis var. sinensis]